MKNILQYCLLLVALLELSHHRSYKFVGVCSFELHTKFTYLKFKLSSGTKLLICRIKFMVISIRTNKKE